MPQYTRAGQTGCLGPADLKTQPPAEIDDLTNPGTQTDLHHTAISGKLLNLTLDRFFEVFDIA